MAAYDDLNVKRIFSVGILSCVVTAVTALAVSVVYYWLVQVQTAETAAASNYQRQNRILQEQQDEIESYGVDPETGNIIVPIDVAIEQMVGADKSDSPSEESQASEDSGNQDSEKETSEET